MDVRQMKCVHCGKTWGGHYNEWCDYHRTGATFLPVGINETDICERCGKQFIEHRSHIYCGLLPAGCVFVKKQYFLPDELFEV